MKLRCSLVSRKLNNLTSSESLPESVMRHIEGCEDCRREASAYTKLGNMLRDCDPSEERTELTWDKLRSALSDHPGKAHTPRVTLVPAPVWAVLIVTVLAASLFWFNRQPNVIQVPDPDRQAVVQQDDRATEVQPTRPKNTATIAKKQEQPVPKREVNSRVAVASQPVPSADNHTADRRVPAHRKNMIKHNVQPAPKLAAVPKYKTSPAAPVTVAENNESDTSTDGVELAVVGAEEHVIDVVGVGDGDTNNHEYVIQQVGYSPDQAYTKL